MTAIHAQPKRDPRSSFDQGTFNTSAEVTTPVELATMLGCMYALIVANLVQVLAGFAAADPSPPAAVVPGIAATAVLGLGALPMIRSAQTAGYKLGIAFCLASMVGMGPHKLFLENGGVIAPMALVGFAFELVFILHAVRALRVSVLAER
ncbi:MAG: hypothetical protein HKN03_04425 [Acidimicrobiales bacterium]|nr:hypothetical protein [Acidimicrobiia bacterium]NND12403.1 hypothetical protein [Acidimicrobiia bacterium]NNF53672.1 hypothetical protein [Acidimicrobiales bacterium]